MFPTFSAGEKSSALLPTSGPISELVASLISTPARPVGALAAGDPVGEAVTALLAAVEDPISDDDLQLALYLAFELHYRGFEGIDPGWEWSPELLSIRGRLERAFLGSLEASLPPTEPVDPLRLAEELFRLEAADEGVSLSRHLETMADLEQFREFVVHRSLYQLKESDPHSWAIPRLTGPAKTALLEVQSDEYGGGRPERMHSTLFAKTMRALDLDDRENAYLDRVPGETLATVNLMSALGLRRERRGAIVGHLAMFEMTSSLPNRRYGNALRRLGLTRGHRLLRRARGGGCGPREHRRPRPGGRAGSPGAGAGRGHPLRRPRPPPPRRSLRASGPGELAGRPLLAAPAAVTHGDLGRKGGEAAYVLPLRWSEPGPIDELASYLRSLRGSGLVTEVLVVDG